jgi:hypothetical protein
MHDPNFVNSWLQGLTFPSHTLPRSTNRRFQSSTSRTLRFRSLTVCPSLAIVRLLWFSAGPATLVVLALLLMEAPPIQHSLLKSFFSLTLSGTLCTRVFGYYILNDRLSVCGNRLRDTGLLIYAAGLLLGAGSLLFVADTVAQHSADLRMQPSPLPLSAQPTLAQSDADRVIL